MVIDGTSTVRCLYLFDVGVLGWLGDFDGGSDVSVNILKLRGAFTATIRVLH